MEPQSAMSRELAQLFEQDQKDHQGGSYRTPKQWQAIQERDRRSRMRVRDLMRQGSLVSAEESFKAAIILQHGDQAVDFLEAHIRGC